MSYAGSGGDDQSEDGELRHSPSDIKARQEEILDFSLSDEDADTADSLDIKPPQANRLPRGSGRSKRRERREGRSRHNRSEKHREERSHSHREKHHRDRSNRERTREYHREYHKELYRYSEAHGTSSSQLVSKYFDSQYRRQADDLVTLTQNQAIRYERKYEEKKDKHDKHERYEKELRYQQEQEKSRRYDEKSERRLKSVADQTLDDLRERLLDKKRLKDATEDFGPSSSKHHSEKEFRRRIRPPPEHLEISAVEQDAEMYVKEIIDLSGGNDELSSRERKERHHKKQDVKVHEEEMEVEKKILDAETEEQELRKEKLLQAEREIARQKEQYKLDRERRHQRRQERQERQVQEARSKRARVTDLSVVTVSDTSSHSSGSRSRSTISPHSSSEHSSTSEDAVEEDEHSEGESTSADEVPALKHQEVEDDSDNSDVEQRNVKESPISVQLAKSDRSSSRSRSKSSSPKNNGQMNAKTEKETEVKTPAVEENIPKKLSDDLPPYFPAIQGCRSVEEFQCLNRIEEGTYGVVYRARDKRTDEIVALKRLKMEKEKEGFPITSLREINTLLKGQHPNIVTVREIVVGSNMDKIFIVMDYVEHDLKSLMETMRNRRQGFVPGEVKCLLKQLLGAVAHLHDNWILHRDLKTSNLLLSHKGILKVGDFGLAREYGSPLKAYTPIVVTLWYRAPELLLCTKEYSTPVDMWSVGCIFAELLLMNALFPGKSEVDQLNRVFKELGTPNERVWPGWNALPAVKKMKFTEWPPSALGQKFSMLSEAGLSLLKRLLTYDPVQRSTAEDALRHPYFTEAPLPIDPAMFPTWPAKSELGHRRTLATSPKPPSGGREYKQLGDDDDHSALGFHITNIEARRIALGAGAGFSLKF